VIDTSGNVGVGVGTTQLIAGRFSVSKSLNSTSNPDAGIIMSIQNPALPLSGGEARFLDFGSLDVSTAFIRVIGRNLSILGGNVGIGTTSPSYKLDVAGDISCNNIYYSTLTQRSDASTKTDVQPLSDYLNTDCLDVISCLKPVKYVYVDDPLKTNRFGFIAQNVSEVCPELVTVDTEGKASLNYMDLIALLTQGIQELYEMLGKVIQKIGGIS
jgi:hypothetical protein